MSNGSHVLGTTAKLGASVIWGVLGAVRRVRLPQRPPDSPPDTGDLPRRSFLDRMRKVPRLSVALAVAGVLAVVLVGSAVAGTTFTVNSTGDAPDNNLGNGVCQTATPGECTLRAAIQQANATSNGVTGPDVINFNLPSGGTISPGSQLPTITEAVTIDGGTTHSIVLNGASAGGANGLYINASGVIVKGLVINGFDGGVGINIQSGGSNNKLEGNYIGTNASGNGPVRNANGVYIVGSSNTVGGTTAAERNVISGNGTGVFIAGGPSNQVQGNYIGTNASGDGPVPNGGIGGVLIERPGNTVGGTTSGAGNVISGNNQTGVSIHTNSTLSSVLSNLIFANGGLGIDLGQEGVTGNDPGDGDSGANNFQNFPVLDLAKINSSGTATIRGTLNSTPNTTFNVQFFSNDSADPSGYGEGQIYLGQKTDVVTGGNGDANFTFLTPRAFPQESL